MSANSELVNLLVNMTVMLKTTTTMRGSLRRVLKRQKCVGGESKGTVGGKRRKLGRANMREYRSDATHRPVAATDPLCAPSPMEMSSKRAVGRKRQVVEIESKVSSSSAEL